MAGIPLLASRSLTPQELWATHPLLAGRVAELVGGKDQFYQLQILPLNEIVQDYQGGKQKTKAIPDSIVIGYELENRAPVIVLAYRISIWASCFPSFKESQVEVLSLSLDGRDPFKFGIGNFGPASKIDKGTFARAKSFFQGEIINIQKRLCCCRPFALRVELI